MSLVPEAPKGGFYQVPTLIRDVPIGHRIAQEEIFGPVLVIIAYRDEEEAIRIANDTIYGLGGGVWSQDEAHAVRVARRIRTGPVDINGAPFNRNAPFGGFKQSGFGRELGERGLDPYLETKTVTVSLDPPGR